MTMHNQWVPDLSRKGVQINTQQAAQTTKKAPVKEPFLWFTAVEKAHASLLMLA